MVDTLIDSTEPGLVKRDNFVKLAFLTDHDILCFDSLSREDGCCSHLTSRLDIQEQFADHRSMQSTPVSKLPSNPSVT